MKHLKLFEEFSIDYQKTPLNTKQYSEVELAQMMLDDMGVKHYNIEVIGHGHNGTAYDIGFDKILKITKAYGEWKEARNLVGKDLKHIAKIYQVDKTEDHSEDSPLRHEYFGIIKEKVKLLPSHIKELVRICYVDFYPGREDIWEGGEYNIITDKWIEGYFLSENIQSNAKQVFRQIADMISECLEYNISYEDLSEDNVGLRGTDLVFFDIHYIE